MIRVRFAPSPTGYLHVGGLRTALYAFLFAKKNGGVFILKIEDTDQKRFVEGAIENLIKVLDWAELFRDEGVFTSIEIKDDTAIVVKSKKYPGVMETGEYGPYIQSEKLETYKQYAQKLIENGHAYYCFCDSKKLESMRQEQIAKKHPPIYDQHCLKNLNADEIQKNLEDKKSYVIRLKTPKDETIIFSDIIRGEVKFNINLIDDQVLLKSDGYPTYHLANVIDDHDMRITHVIRGEEWLPSVPKHLLLYRYFGWEAPQFAHLPLLLNLDRTKLSKRQGDVAVEDYIKKGYLKEAIVNFTAFLGWHPGEGETQELFTLEELVEKFDLTHVHKAGAVFDTKKLDWINSQYIKKLSVDDLYERALEFLEQKDFYQSASSERRNAKYLKKVLTIEQKRLVKLSEAWEQDQFFFKDPEYNSELLKWKDSSIEDTKKQLSLAIDTLVRIDETNWNAEYLKNILMEVAGEKRGELLWPLRASLTGESKSPSPFETAWVLGKEESLKRIKDALKKL